MEKPVFCKYQILMGGFLSIIKIVFLNYFQFCWMPPNYKLTTMIQDISIFPMEFIWIEDKNNLPTSIHLSSDNWRLHQWHLQKTVPLWWRGYWWWPVDLSGWVEKPLRCTQALSWNQCLQWRTKVDMRHLCNPCCHYT